MELAVLPMKLAVWRLPPGSPYPAQVEAGGFSAMVRTSDELSIVGEEHLAPAEGSVERDWRALKVQGPLEFEMAGVLASIAGPLAGAGISLFVLSTFDTDYILVKEPALEHAQQVLRQAGHIVY